MNWFARNMMAMLLGAGTSVLVAVALIYAEAHTGETLFGTTAAAWIHLKIMAYVPVGAIAAGCVGAIGYLLGAAGLRLRPVLADALVMIAVAGIIVFLVQSADFSLFLGGSNRAYQATRNAKSFSKFLGASLWHTPLRFWSTGSGDDPDSAAIAAFFNPGASGGGSRLGNTGDSKVDDIGGGVQGMMSAQDVSQTSQAQHFAQVGVGITSIGTKVQAHGGEWMLLLTETLGFALGALAVFFHLRSLPHCKGCMLLLSPKGKETRYFARSREMRSSVDEVLMKARDKQLQQSIHIHIAKGSEKQQSWSEYCSTIEIMRCTNCRTHRMEFQARRKDGATWKNIDLLGFSATTLEPVDFS